MGDMRMSAGSMGSIYGSRMMSSAGSLQSRTGSELNSLEERFMCSADPGTRRGRRIQTVLLLTLPSIPVLLLALVTILHMGLQTRDLISIQDFRAQISRSQFTTELVLSLHEERAQAYLHRLLEDIEAASDDITNFQDITIQTDALLRKVNMRPTEELRRMREDTTSDRSESLASLSEAYDRMIRQANELLKFPEARCPKMTQTMLATIASLHIMLAALGTHEQLHFLLMETVLEQKEGNFPSYDIRNVVMERQLNDALLYTDVLDAQDLRVISSQSHLVLWAQMTTQGSRQNDSQEASRRRVNMTSVHRQIIYASIREILVDLSQSSCNERYQDKLESTLAYLVVLLIQIPLFLVIAKNAQSTKQCLHDVVSVYASRTVELKREKRRSDHLLAEMLPKSVARQLKFGESVHAKQYEATTVYFSDIADFADISSTSEPMQVVTFLNNVYSFMDAKMNMYDVYKMETIGSVYMVVSGVPVSNGQRHVVEIANLAVDILRVTEDFVIPHMPLRPLQLRVGIHSGPCCAGVVGNKMPRYCLFGDTINTASRMQSYGLPGKIHISKGTRDLLEEVGGFVVEPRGQVDIKGKGAMATFWLVSKINQKSQDKKRAVVLRTDSSREAWLETA